MAVTVVRKTIGGLTGLIGEVHYITWGAGTDVTHELPTDLSEIHAWSPGHMYGANAGHTDEDMGILELDETVTNGVITVDADGEITINRLESSAAGTLAAQQDVIILWGKS